MTTSVMLVDDQELLRMGFRMVLDAQPDLEVVGEAGDGAEAIALAAELRPRHRAHGRADARTSTASQATREIIASGSPSRIIILTTFDLDEYAYSALRAGASGFLLKNAPPADLLSAIRAVAGGEAVVAPEHDAPAARGDRRSAPRPRQHRTTRPSRRSHHVNAKC